MIRTVVRLVPLAALLAGCVTVRESRALNRFSGEGGDRIVDTVEVVTTGWYLFDLLPIVTGDPAGGCRWFTDNLNAQTNLDALDPIIRREGATRIGTLTSHETDEGILLFLINRHTFRTTATLLKNGDNEQ